MSLRLPLLWAPAEPHPEGEIDPGSLLHGHPLPSAGRAALALRGEPWLPHCLPLSGVSTERSAYSLPTSPDGGLWLPKEPVPTFATFLKARLEETAAVQSCFHLKEVPSVH